MRVLNYRLPIFGDVKITLRKESSRLFKWLDKNKEIRRLSNISQLGVLKKKFSCAHHTKYEYCALLIYLIEKIQQDIEFKNLQPLSGNIREGKTEIASSRSELIKCWAFLLSIGHLHGTFAHEKAVLKYLCLDEKLKNKFLSKFAALDIYKDVEKIVADENYYKFHQVLALYKLLDYYRNKPVSKSDKAVINKGIKYLSFYIAPNKDKYRRAKDIFSRLRKISYILLDSHYSNVLFSFNCNYITEETIKATLRKDGESGYVVSLWSALDAYLMGELYKNKTSLFIENLAYRSLFNKLRRSKNGLRFIMDRLMDHDSSYLDATFNKFIAHQKIDVNKMDEYNLELKLSIANVRLFDIERRLDNICKIMNKKKTYIDYVVDKDINRQKVNDIYIYSKNWNRETPAAARIDPLLFLLLRFCVISEKNMKGSVPLNIKKILINIQSPSGYYSYLNLGNWNKITLFIMKLIFKSTLKLNSVHIDKSLPLDAIIISSGVIKKISYDKKNQELNDLFTLAMQILETNKRNGMRGRVVIYPFNVKIKSKKDGKDKTDIDSAIINITAGKYIDMYMIQSKGKNQRYQDARKQAINVRNMLIRKYGNKNTSELLPISKDGKSVVLKVRII